MSEPNQRSIAHDGAAARGLSVVVALQKKQPVERCLASLIGQRADGVALQIVLVGAPDAGWIPSLDPPHVAVRSPHRSLPMLHGSGIAHAAHPLIAFTEAHCSFEAGWAEAAIAAMSDGCAAAGGAVVCSPELRGISRALYWADYVAFAPPLEARATAELPGNNVVFRRDALPEDAHANGFWKSFHCQALERRGAAMKLDPALVVEYGRRISLVELVSRRYHHGRCFGGMRAREMSLARRIAATAAAPLLPFVLTARVARRAVGRARIGAFLHSIFVMNALWIAGEAVGNAFGSGSSCGEL